MTDKQYRKKPVVIEAIQWNGANCLDVADFCGDDILTAIEDFKSFKVVTLEGKHIASVGDYIIRGVKGEHYPCKPDIFELTYEPVEASPTPPNTITIPVDEYERLKNYAERWNSLIDYLDKELEVNHE